MDHAELSFHNDIFTLFWHYNNMSTWSLKTTVMSHGLQTSYNFYGDWSVKMFETESKLFATSVYKYIYMYIYIIYILIKRAALYREQVMSVESTFDFWRFKPIFSLNPCKIHNYLVTPVLITFGSELRKRQPGVTLPKAPTTNYDGVFLEPLPTAEILDNVCARVANFYAVISRLFVK